MRFKILEKKIRGLYRISGWNSSHQIERCGMCVSRHEESRNTQELTDSIHGFTLQDARC